MSTFHADRCEQSEVTCAYALQVLPASEAAAAELLRHLVAEEPAQPGGHVRQLRRRLRRDRLPAEEVVKQREQFRGSSERRTRGFDIPRE